MKKPGNSKGTKSGMIIVLDEDYSFEELKDALIEKFAASASFFGQATVALAFEGKRLTDAEKYEIAELIQANTELNIVCITEDDPNKEEFLSKSLK